MAGIVLVVSSIAVKKLRIDDPLDSISVHLSAVLLLSKPPLIGCLLLALRSVTIYFLEVLWSI